LDLPAHVNYQNEEPFVLAMLPWQNFHSDELALEAAFLQRRKFALQLSRLLLCFYPISILAD
jgi:hypothetical protein